MSYHNNYIKTLQKKLGSCSDLERIVYSEAITLIENEVNPDKVGHWVKTTLSTFNNKPQPLSEKEKLKRKQKADRKAKRNAEKKALFEDLTNQLKTVVAEFGVITIGFFDWKEITDSEYKFLVDMIKSKGFKFTDPGSGAYEPHVSKEKLDQKALSTLRKIRFELDEIYPGKETLADEYYIDDITDFRKKLSEVL